MEITHIPVLLEETVDYLNCQAGGIYLDATLGSGGHALKILEDNPEIKALIAIDWDEVAIKSTRKKLQSFSQKTFIFQENFINIPAVLKRLKIKEVNGILLDLGVSSQHLDDQDRGFSFRLEGPLDMRMDRNLSTTAFDLVNTSSSSQLKQIFFNYGEERFAPRIARAIVNERQKEPIADTLKLSELVTSAIPPKYRPRKIHPATKTFQALRIAVNNELENLREVIGASIDLLAQGGRLCIITFHSLEDRIVKHQFRTLSGGYSNAERFLPQKEVKPGKIKLITRKPVTPQPEEIRKNPRARSAKLRVVEKLNT
jgi:16S rRNA (cytosine1402-N4)-methyltransferase